MRSELHRWQIHESETARKVLTHSATDSLEGEEMPSERKLGEWVIEAGNAPVRRCPYCKENRRQATRWCW